MGAGHDVTGSPRNGIGVPRLAQAVEQAVQSVDVIWEGEGGRILFGDFSNAKIVGYRVGAKEWEHLIRVCRELEVADV